MFNHFIIVALYDYVIIPDDELCGAGLSLTSSVKTCILRSVQKLGKMDRIVIKCSPGVAMQCGQDNCTVLLMQMQLVIVLVWKSYKQAADP